MSNNPRMRFKLCFHTLGQSNDNRSYNPLLPVLTNLIEHVEWLSRWNTIQVNIIIPNSFLRYVRLLINVLSTSSLELITSNKCSFLDYQCSVKAKVTETINFFHKEYSKLTEAANNNHLLITCTEAKRLFPLFFESFNFRIQEMFKELRRHIFYRYASLWFPSCWCKALYLLSHWSNQESLKIYL